MTTINVNAVEPAGATLTIGETGDTVKVNDSVNVNTVKDAGGNTLWVSNGSGVLSSVSGFGDALVLLSTQTPSGATEVEFTSLIDSSYVEYIFKFITINPATDSSYLVFNGSSDGGDNYNVEKTSTFFSAEHGWDASSYDFSYRTSYDLAEGAGFQYMTGPMGNDASANVAAELHLYNPSSTTYVKNWMGSANMYHNADYMARYYFAGYFNTTSAIDAMKFYMSDSGAFDGIIKMYGVK